MVKLADRKKKTPARNLLKSSKKKLVIESVKSGFPDDAESKNTGAQALFKGNPNKAVKSSVKNAFNQAKKKGKVEELNNKKTPLQTALSATSNRAIRDLAKAGIDKLQEPYRIAQEQQKALNREFKKQQNLLLRRIKYIRDKGLIVDDSLIPYRIEGDATAEDITRLRSIGRDEIKKHVVGYDTNIPTNNEYDVFVNTPKYLKWQQENGITITPEQYKSIVMDYRQHIFETGSNISFLKFAKEQYHTAQTEIPPVAETDPEDKVSDYDFSDLTSSQENEQKVRTPQDEYYRDNSDRQYDDGLVEEGRIILDNIYAEIEKSEGSWGYYYVGRNNIRPWPEELQEIKQEARETLWRSLRDAIGTYGEDEVCKRLARHGSEINTLITKILYGYVGRGEIEANEIETTGALFQFQAILFEGDSEMLAEVSLYYNGDL